MTPEIPGALLALFRAAQYDAAATRSFEWLAGGFMWSDEGWRPIHDASHAHGLLRIPRALLAYRASLSLGTPRLGFAPVWATLEAAVPDWPGFRPDRCSQALGPALQRARQYDHDCR
jgi:hypothetical protein